MSRFRRLGTTVSAFIEAPLLHARVALLRAERDRLEAQNAAAVEALRIVKAAIRDQS
jgi:hypothetical protein